MMFTKQTLLPLALLARASLAQDDDSSSATGGLECSATLLSLVFAGPTPTGALGSAITSYAESYAESYASASGTDIATSDLYNPAIYVTQVCEFSSQLPSSLQSDFDEYATKLVSFLSASSSAIDAAITDCVVAGDEGASYTSIINSFAARTGPLCADATDGPSVTDSNGNPVPTTSSTPEDGAAAKPTAVAAAAVAAAGILGAAILL